MYFIDVIHLTLECVGQRTTVRASLYELAFVCREVRRHLRACTETVVQLRFTQFLDCSCLTSGGEIRANDSEIEMLVSLLMVGCLSLPILPLLILDASTSGEY